MILVHVARAGEALRCALCHGALGSGAHECASCGTVSHRDCRAGVRACPTLGCAPVAIRRGRRGRSRLWYPVVLFLLGYVALFGLFKAIPTIGELSRNGSRNESSVLRIQHATRLADIALDCAQASTGDERLEELARARAQCVWAQAELGTLPRTETTKHWERRVAALLAQCRALEAR